MSRESDLLAHAARRVSLRPSWFGHAISRYCQTHGLTDDLLADWLGCTPEVVVRLRLCGLPSTDEHYLGMAEKFGVRVEMLREIVA